MDCDGNYRHRHEFNSLRHDFCNPLDKYTENTIGKQVQREKIFLSGTDKDFQQVLAMKRFCSRPADRYIDQKRRD